MKQNFYDRGYFNERDHLDELSAKTIEIILNDNHLKKVLDVGCGTGRLVRYLNQKGFRAFGTDIEDWALKYARKINKRGVILKAGATKLPFESKSLDLVSCLSVVEHLSKKDGVIFIKEAKRVLKKNGFIFLITPNFASPMRYILGKKWFGYSDPTHIYFYKPGSLEKILKKNGFKNIRFKTKTAYNLKTHWYLPSYCRRLPMPIKNFLTYLMISSPLSKFRDSFWTVAEKK